MPDEIVFPEAHPLPFEIPANFAALDDAELQGLSTQLAEYASPFLALETHTEDSVAALEASAAFSGLLRGELDGRNSRFARARTSAAAVAEAQQAAAQFAVNTSSASAATGGEDEDGDGGDEGGDENTPAVTASATRSRPTTRQIARGSTTPTVNSTDGPPAAFAVMKATADVPNFSTGQQLTNFSEAARALEGTLNRYPTMSAGRAQRVPGKRPVTVYEGVSEGGRPALGRTLQMRSYNRHNGVQFVRQFPEQLRVSEGGGNGYAVAEYAANERNLSAGNLIRSVAQRVASGRAITAAAGWCAPSEVIYELCELESLDGLLSVPELQTSRGGWQIPIDGGPNFSSIWNGIGNNGDTHLTEAQVQEGIAKVCTEIPCPDFEDIRLGVDYVCLTGGLLQRRGYPEMVARFSRGAMIALAHKMNMGAIQQMVANSGLPIVVPQVDNGDDAAAAILSAVELAVTDIKYHNRMPFGSTLEVVMPLWFLPQIRAGLARRRGVLALAVTDSEIVDWFAMRRSAPQFVYDWQDAFSGLAGGPGGATPLEAFPTSGQFLVYPSGTWVRAVQDVVNLDTIYDSTLLETNQYTAIFAEDGWAMLQMCPDSRVYEVALNPDGVVGCCPPTEVSL